MLPKEAILQKNHILISACLLGEKVRYDGNDLSSDLLIEHPILKSWLKQNQLISICPEVSGGLPIPRPPAEIQKLDGNLIKIINIKNIDVTNEFSIGAKKALAVCQKNNIKIAILTESSPSCGSSKIYDGRFKNNKIAGEGITTKLLRKNNIKVFSQYQLEEAYDFYQVLDLGRSDSETPDLE